MSTPSLELLSDARYVLLTTYRRPQNAGERGVPVSTAVWIAPEGDHLLVMTQGATGKVKRIGHTPAVTLQPCTTSGKPIAGAPVVEATASILTDAGAIARRDAAFMKKYGFQFRFIRWSHRKRSSDAIVIELRLTA
jgi:PPOX class probable F420-dependent enzyme